MMLSHGVTKLCYKEVSPNGVMVFLMQGKSTTADKAKMTSWGHGFFGVVNLDSAGRNSYLYRSVSCSYPSFTMFAAKEELK